jgi:tRNA N6-adenosine threonylcarbamoyltransferase
VPGNPRYYHAMLILGIETSCDETGVALYDTRDGLLADALHSQVELHALYGGVVPELASRDHVRRLLPLAATVLERAGKRVEDIDLVAYTQGPGLSGALLVGASIATGIGLALSRPVVGIHHLEGHLLSPLLADPRPEFPFIALLVSGGHTQLMRVDGVGRYALLGETQDDAAGEAFDKTATLLGLGYPGGPALSKLAAQGDPDAFAFPTAARVAGLDFSFAGLKTALLYKVRDLGEEETARRAADLAASYEHAIVEALIVRVERALATDDDPRLAIGGGVAANRLLRERAAALGVPVHIPPPELCTDNAAMIASAARFVEPVAFPGYLDVDAYAHAV